jgi:RNA polymerase sigma-70 factor (ECF subfamily)
MPAAREVFEAKIRYGLRGIIRPDYAGNRIMADQRPTRAEGRRASKGSATDWEDTRDLLERAKAGDREALGRVYERYLPPLRRWATGRLPRWARSAIDTDDIVQQAMLDTLKRIDHFEPRHDGALQAYIRQALLNRIRDEIERAHRRPRPAEVRSDQVDPSPSPLEETVGREALHRYEEALLHLSEEARQAIVLRIEMGLPYEKVAVALGKPTANAARMTVTRALVKLAQEMGHAPKR